MAKTRLVILARELKIDVHELIQCLKDELGLEENFTYLSSLDEETVARVRQRIKSRPRPQVEKLRINENIIRRRRIEPGAISEVKSVPSIEPTKSDVKTSPSMKFARVVTFPSNIIIAKLECWPYLIDKSKRNQTEFRQVANVKIDEILDMTEEIDHNETIEWLISNIEQLNDKLNSLQGIVESFTVGLPEHPGFTDEEAIHNAIKNEAILDDEALEQWNDWPPEFASSELIIPLESIDTIRERIFEFANEKLDPLKEYVEELEGSLEKIVPQYISPLFKYVKKIETRIERMKKSRPVAFGLAEERIFLAQKIAKNQQTKHFFPPKNASSLVRALRNDNFYLDEENANDILRGLEASRLLVLEGPPGTGKTKLAKLLPKHLLHSKQEKSFTFASVTPMWTTHESIGGVTMVDNHLGPTFGYITEAVLKAIENDGQHWLILDEINRGDMNIFLAPIFAGMELDDDIIHHPNLFPDQSNQSGEIPIPGSFRIIGTMNTFDKDQLFDFSEALKRRVYIVKLNPPDENTEAGLLDELVIAAFAKKMGPKWTIKSLKNTYHIDKAVDEILKIVNRIRSLGKNNPAIVYRYTKIGTAIVMNTLKDVCGQLMSINERKKPITHKAVLEAVDHSISTVFLNNLPIRNPEVLSRIYEEVFVNRSLVNSRLVIKNLLDRYRMF
jgi:MoxR-like ATPase